MLDVEFDVMEDLAAAFKEGQQIEIDGEPTDLEELLLRPAGRVGDGQAGVGQSSGEEVRVVGLDRQMGAGLRGEEESSSLGEKRPKAQTPSKPTITRNSTTPQSIVSSLRRADPRRVLLEGADIVGR